MTTLVTGGAGYIGSHMVLALVDAGRPIVVLDDLSTGNLEAIPPGIPFYEGDCADTALVTRIIRDHRIRTVVHFAGSIRVDESVTNPLAYYHNNTVRSRALVEAAVTNNVEGFIFSSTAAVYGNAAETPTPETAPLVPLSPYGASKMMTEMMLRDVDRAHRLRHTILRYFNVAGADPAMRSGLRTAKATHLIKVACEAAVGRRPGMEIHGDDYPTPDGTTIRDYIHVSDLARIHLLALERLERGGDSITLNCGYGRGASVREVVDVVQQETDREFLVRVGPRRPGDPASIVARADRVRTELGWKPQFDDLSLIVRHALSWERRERDRRRAGG